MGSTDNTNGPGQTPGGQFPMAETIDAALPLLRRPFSPSAVRAKVQSQDRAKPPNWGQIARYIDARLVSERLNLVAGGRWSYEYAPLDPALRPPVRDGEQAPLHVVCSLTVLGQTHTDVGEGRDPKAAFSDALKRAAVPFGIGRSIYSVPRRFLFAEESRLPPRDKLRRRGERLYLTDANELLLREEYERWLTKVGVAAFGEPLEHGPDQAEAVEEESDKMEGEGAPVTDAGNEAPSGGLRAVSDGSPQEPPATIHERRRLMALVAAAGYSEQTVKELAALTLGERLLDRLSARQVGELERMVTAASAGAVDDARLAKRVKSAAEQSGGGEAVRRALDALLRDGQQGDRKVA